MRAKIATLEEALNFIIEKATPEEKRIFIQKLIDSNKMMVQQELFSVVEDVVLVPPCNQHELVLHTLIFPPKELSGNYWSQIYKTMKWSTRLGEVENRLNLILVKREFKEFINRFGHKSSYVVYTPILDKNEYIKLYNELKKQK